MQDELPMDMMGISKTPAASHLFSVNKEGKQLHEDKARLFHDLVGKLL